MWPPIFINNKIVLYQFWSRVARALGKVWPEYTQHRQKCLSYFSASIQQLVYSLETFHLDLHESIMHLYIYSPFTEESSYSVWEPHSDAPAKFHMSSPVQLWFSKWSGERDRARLKRYHTSSDCILGTMDLHSFKAQISISIFCLSGVDVCGESLHSLALHRPPFHLHTIY